jgi:hypothetical protein
MPGLVLIVLHTRVFADSLLVSWMLPGDLADVGDPSASRERWPVARLAASWRGLGLRLVGGVQQ